MKEIVHTRKVAQKCEGPNFGVGSIGKVKVLMMQELEPVPSKRRTSSTTVPVSIYCFESRKKSERKKTKSDQTKSSSTTSNSSGNATNIRRPENAGNKVRQTPPSHSLPMLESEDIPLEKTPMRGGPERRRARAVEIVDLNCGNRSRKVSSSPIADQLRRVGFSKLSD